MPGHRPMENDYADHKTSPACLRCADAFTCRLRRTAPEAPAPRRCRTHAGPESRSRQPNVHDEGALPAEQDTVAGKAAPWPVPGTGSRPAVCQTFDDNAGLGVTRRDKLPSLAAATRSVPQTPRIDQNGVVATANPSRPSPSTSIPVPMPIAAHDHGRPVAARRCGAHRG